MASQRAKKKDYDLVIGVTGEEGVGKTTFTKQFGMAVDHNYDLVKNGIYTNEDKEIREKVNNPKIFYIDVDEAIKLLYKLEWYSPMQKLINKIYGLCRKKNKISAFCMPRFIDFNEYFRNHRIKWWVHVVDRGIAVIFTKDWSPVAKDPWWKDEMQRIIDTDTRRKKVGQIGTEEKLRILRKSRNYLTEVRFPDLPPKMKEEYLKLSEESMADLEKEGKTMGISEREKQLRERLGMALKHLKDIKKMRYVDIAKLINAPWESIRSYIKNVEKPNSE